MERRRSIAKYLLLFKVPKLDNLTSRRGEKSEIISSSPCKRKLRQDQDKITKTNEIETKITIENKKKNIISKKEINVDNRIDFSWF